MEENKFRSDVVVSRIDPSLTTTKASAEVGGATFLFPSACLIKMETVDFIQNVGRVHCRRPDEFQIIQHLYKNKKEFYSSQDVDNKLIRFSNRVRINKQDTHNNKSSSSFKCFFVLFCFVFCRLNFTTSLGCPFQQKQIITQQVSCGWFLNS